MSAEFEPPPTYTLPVQVNVRGEQEFNSHWISWFYKLVQWLNAGGGPSPAGPSSTVTANQIFGMRSEVTQTTVKRLRSDAQMIIANQMFGG